MWRYLIGAVGALLLVGAGVLILGKRGDSGRADAAAPLALATSAQKDVSQAGGDLPAASDKTREERRFGRYDKDRDSAITREEYLAPRRKAFAKLDANGDGTLSFDEWAVKTTTRFADADADRSGALTAAEFSTTAPKRKPQARCLCTPLTKETED